VKVSEPFLVELEFRNKFFWFHSPLVQNYSENADTQSHTCRKQRKTKHRKNKLTTIVTLKAAVTINSVPYKMSNLHL